MDDPDGMRPGNLDCRCVIATWRRLLHDEEGVALVLALISMMVLTIMVTAVLVHDGRRRARRAALERRPARLLDRGVGPEQRARGPRSELPGTAGYPGDATLLPATHDHVHDGNHHLVRHTRQRACRPRLVRPWTITSVGSVPNPTGPDGGAGHAHGPAAVVPVIVPPVTQIRPEQPAQLHLRQRDQLPAVRDGRLARLRGRRSPTCRTPRPSASGSGDHPPAVRPNKFAVGGNFYEEQNANKVGHVNGSVDPTNDLGEIYIQGHCSTKTNTPLHALRLGHTDQIWATTHGNAIPPDFLTYVPKLTCCAPLHRPRLARALRGGTQQHGRGVPDCRPRAALARCTHRLAAGVGLPERVRHRLGRRRLDLNNSATPARTLRSTSRRTSYSCKSRAGELSWNGSTNKLTVRGTVFIDGSATIHEPGRPRPQYAGQGPIFLTGTFMMKNALMCVKTTGNGNNTHCDTSAGAWDPNVGALIIVADGDGGYDPTQSQSNNVTSARASTSRAPTSRARLIANKDDRRSTRPRRCRAR